MNLPFYVGQVLQHLWTVSDNEYYRIIECGETHATVIKVNDDGTTSGESAVCEISTTSPVGFGSAPGLWWLSNMDREIVLNSSFTQSATETDSGDEELYQPPQKRRRLE